MLEIFSNTRFQYLRFVVFHFISFFFYHYSYSIQTRLDRKQVQRVLGQQKASVIQLAPINNNHKSVTQKLAWWVKISIQMLWGLYTIFKKICCLHFTSSLVYFIFPPYQYLQYFLQYHCSTWFLFSTILPFLLLSW